MGVYIKGMEMPKTCWDCACSIYYESQDKAMCDITDETLDYTLWKRERRPDCPLIDIPTPHGRLGDLDKLNIHDISPVDGFCVMGVTEEDIELADTVIETEGET